MVRLKLLRKITHPLILVFAVTGAHQTSAVIYGAATYQDSVTGNCVTFLQDIHLDLPDLKHTEQQRYAIQNVLQRYCTGLVVEDMIATGDAEKMPNVRQVFETELAEFLRVKHLFKPYRIRIDGQAWQPSESTTVMFRLADYCDSIKFPCINVECRQMMRGAFRGTLPVSGNDLLDNLRNHVQKISAFAQVADENSQEIKDYYGACSQKYTKYLDLLTTRIGQLKTTVEGTIKMNDLVQASDLVDGYSIHAIRSFQHNRHTLVCQGGAHCKAQAAVLLRSGYKKVFSHIHLPESYKTEDGVNNYRIETLEIADYFDQLQKRHKILPNKPPAPAIDPLPPKKKES